MTHDLFTEGGECRPGALPADHRPNNDRQGEIAPDFTETRTPRSLAQAGQASSACCAVSRSLSRSKQHAVSSFPNRRRYSPKQPYPVSICIMWYKSPPHPLPTHSSRQGRMASTVRTPVVGGLFSRVVRHSRNPPTGLPPQSINGRRSYDPFPPPSCSRMAFTLE